LLQLSFFFLPAQSRAMTILYLRPWLLASMPLLMAWTLFGTGLMPHYRSPVFQRMPAAGLVLDQQQRILALNPAAEQLLQTRAEQVEGKLLPQAFPVLKDATDTVTIDGETYGYEISLLPDRAGQSSGQLIRLSPQPSAVSVQQLYHDLGLKPDDLTTQLPTGDMVEFNYLDNLVFQYTTHFYTTLEMVKTFSAVIDRIIEAAQERGGNGSLSDNRC